MVTSSYKQAQQYKSRPSVVAGFLYRGRATHKRRSRQWQLRCEQQERQVATLNEHVRQLEAENKQLKSRPLQLPSDPRLPHHGYGARLIALCVNLAQKIGLRSTPVVLKIFWDWLGITAALEAGRRQPLVSVENGFDPAGGTGGPHVGRSGGPP